MSIRARVDRIRAYTHFKGWRPYQLSRAAGLAEGACYGMDDPAWNPRFKTLLKLEAVVPEDFDPEAVYPTSEGGPNSERRHSKSRSAIRNSLYDRGARKRTVSVSLNSDLYAKAQGLGLNLSKVTEEALAQALAQHLAEQAKAEIDRDLQALNAFVEAHGSFAEMVREHYAAVDGDAPV